MATCEELRDRLQSEGVILLRGFFSPEPLIRLREAATRCFAKMEADDSVRDPYRFTAQASSFVLTTLLNFGIGSEKELLAPLAAVGLDVIYSGWRCRLEHCWVRKKLAPRNASRAGHQIQDWHQDGALGVQFPPEPGPEIPATKLVTCWIPLDACGRVTPGLEFIRAPRLGLLHFSELNDAALRRRFDPAAFWAPELEFGDGLVFRNDVLHRTHVTDQMLGDRISVEYRLLPGEI